MNATPMRLVVIEADPGGATRGAWFEPGQREALAKALGGGTAAIVFEIDLQKLDQVDADFPAGKMPLGGAKPNLPSIKRAAYERLATLAQPAPAAGPLPAEAPKGDPLATVKAGSVVLASDSRDEGWFEAVVVKVEQNGATLRLKWQSFPDLAEFSKPLNRVAIPPASGMR